MFWEYITNVVGICWGCAWDVLWMLSWYPKNIFADVLGVSLGLVWRLFRDVVGIYMLFMDSGGNLGSNLVRFWIRFGNCESDFEWTTSRLRIHKQNITSIQLLDRFTFYIKRNRNQLYAIRIRLIGSEKDISWESKAHFLGIQSTFLVLLSTI